MIIDCYEYETLYMAIERNEYFLYFKYMLMMEPKYFYQYTKNFSQYIDFWILTRKYQHQALTQRK